jgi:hypothetical protein
MASGHVNRTQRPNTWLHRPSLRREDSPCQLGAVHTWPSADIAVVPTNVRFSNRLVGVKRFQTLHDAGSKSLAGSCFSTESALRPFHHGIRRRGGTIF